MAISLCQVPFSVESLCRHFGQVLADAARDRFASASAMQTDVGKGRRPELETMLQAPKELGEALVRLARMPDAFCCVMISLPLSRRELT